MPSPRAARRAVLTATILLGAAGCDSYATDPDFETNPGIAPASQLTIVNQSASTMSEIYYAPCSVSSFGTSRGSLAGFGTRAFNVTPDCYDLRVVYSTRAIREQRVEIPRGQSRSVTFTN